MPASLLHPPDTGVVEPAEGYRTKQQQVPVAGVQDLLIQSLFDRLQYFDPDGAAERAGISAAAWPIFGQLWPSGAQLAARLAARAVRPGERILEIGCGLALASLVGHRRGADVTASDVHPLVRTFLTENLRLNHLPPMKYLCGRWGAPVMRRRTHGAGDQPVVRSRYDLIVGADVLYERDARGALSGFIARHLSDSGEVWIVDPDRGNRSAFNRQMAARGFTRFEQRIDRPANGPEPAYRGRLLVYRRDPDQPAAGAPRVTVGPLNSEVITTLRISG